MKQILVLLSLILSLPSFAQLPQLETAKDADSALKLFARMPIQNGGRLKPLDSFARDSVLFIAEKRRLRGEFSADEPLDVLLNWLNDGEGWSKKNVIYVGNSQVRAKLGLDAKRTDFSPLEISQAPQINSVMSEIQRKQQSNLKLDSVEQGAARVASKLELFQAIANGAGWTIVPHKEHWISLADEKALETGLPQLIAGVLAEKQRGNVEGLSHTVNELVSRQALLFMRMKKEAEPNVDMSKELMGMASLMNREAFFNTLRPFQKSWIIYLVSLVFFLISLMPNARVNRAGKLLGWVFLIGGFAMHTYGFVLRCLLTGRPPVTNMYESTIWVPWGVILFAIIIAALYRKHPKMSAIPISAAAVTVISLVLSDNAPAVLDPTIKPLEPVLRSNYWLTIHVLTITLSYGAFALSVGLGNLVLGLYWRKPKEAESINLYSQFMYRAVQFGVVLLAAGTILGGVWADYSWGRFWGWDPKETWALIALLMYIAVLHGKWAGWLKNFGVVVGTVVCFLGVLMAWYGVNFVLGVGLHSYGFASGGLEALTAYVILQTIFVAFVVLKVKTSLKIRAS